MTAGAEFSQYRLKEFPWSNLSTNTPVDLWEHNHIRFFTVENVLIENALILGTRRLHGNLNYFPLRPSSILISFYRLHN